MVTPYHFPASGKMVLSASRKRVTKFECTPISVNAVFSRKPRLVGNADYIGTQRTLHSCQYVAPVRYLTRWRRVVIERPAVSNYM